MLKSLSLINVSLPQPKKTYINLEMKRKEVSGNCFSNPSALATRVNLITSARKNRLRFFSSSWSPPNSSSSSSFFLKNVLVELARRQTATYTQCPMVGNDNVRVKGTKGGGRRVAALAEWKKIWRKVEEEDEEGKIRRPRVVVGAKEELRQRGSTIPPSFFSSSSSTWYSPLTHSLRPSVLYIFALQRV